MKTLVRLALVGLGLLWGVGTLAADFKVGVMDVHKLIEKSPEVKKLNARLKKEFTPKKQAILKAQRSLQQKAERMKRELAVMSDAEKSDLQAKLVVEQRKLQRLQQDYQQDIGLVQNKEMKKFFSRLKKSVDTFANKNHYDIILQKDAAPYSSKKIDVTNAILKSMG